MHLRVTTLNKTGGQFIIFIFLILVYLMTVSVAKVSWSRMGRQLRKNKWVCISNKPSCAKLIWRSYIYVEELRKPQKYSRYCSNVEGFYPTDISRYYLPFCLRTDTDSASETSCSVPNTRRWTKPRNKLKPTLINLQIDAQNSYLFTYNTFIKILYIFRASSCSSSGGLRSNCIYADSGIVTLCR